MQNEAFVRQLQATCTISTVVDTRLSCTSVHLHASAYLAFGAARHPAYERLGGRAVDIDPIRGGTLSHLAVDEVANIELHVAGCRRMAGK